MVLSGFFTVFKCTIFIYFSNIHYIDFDGNEHYYTMTEYPPEIEKKVKLLNYFMNYMKEHLLKAGANMQTRDGDELSRIPFLRTWFRTSRAVVMFLTNGTVQVIQCFFTSSRSRGIYIFLKYFRKFLNFPHF